MFLNPCSYNIWILIPIYYNIGAFKRGASPSFFFFPLSIIGICILSMRGIKGVRLISTPNSSRIYL